MPAKPTAVLVGLHAMAAASLWGQAAGARAVVTPETTPVYPAMGTQKPPVLELRKGDRVTIGLVMFGDDITWCAVMRPGESKRLGYVSCEVLAPDRDGGGQSGPQPSSAAAPGAAESPAPAAAPAQAPQPPPVQRPSQTAAPASPAPATGPPVAVGPASGATSPPASVSPPPASVSAPAASASAPPASVPAPSAPVPAPPASASPPPASASAPAAPASPPPASASPPPASASAPAAPVSAPAAPVPAPAASASAPPAPAPAVVPTAPALQAPATGTQAPAQNQGIAPGSSAPTAVAPAPAPAAGTGQTPPPSPAAGPAPQDPPATQPQPAAPPAPQPVRAGIRIRELPPATLRIRELPSTSPPPAVPPPAAEPAAPGPSLPNAAPAPRTEPPAAAAPNPPAAAPAAAPPAAAPPVEPAPPKPSVEMPTGDLAEWVIDEAGLHSQINLYVRTTSLLAFLDKSRLEELDTKALAEILTHHFNAPPFLRAVGGELRSQMTPERNEALVTRLRSPIVRKMATLEREAGAPDVRERLLAFAGGLKASPPSQNRLELVHRLFNATEASDVEVETTMAIVKSLAEALNPSLPAAKRFRKEDLNRALENVKATYLGVMKNARIVQYLFVFQSATDEEVEQYVKFWESEPGMWVSAARKRGFESGARMVGRGLAAEIDRRARGGRETK